MEGDSLSFAVNHQKASKNGRTTKKTKRKLSSITNESNGVIPTVKKIKLSKPEKSLSDARKNGQCQYLSDYVKVIAKPGEAPSPPRIFQSNQLKSDVTDVSNCFLLKFLSPKTFNTQVNARFKQENINHWNDDVDEGKRSKCKQANREKQEKESGRCERTKHRSEEEVEESSHVDMYEVVQRKALVFHMHHPGKISFNGEIKATIISGEVEILGYTLSQGSQRDSIDVYSPNFCTPLIIQTKANTKLNQSLEEIQLRLKPFLRESDLDTLLRRLKPNDSLLLVEQIISDLGMVLNKYFDKTLFPKDLEDVSSMTETMKSLQSIFTFNLTKEGKHFRKGCLWDRIQLGDCTVLCGGKGVGKSTLLRYYINKLVSAGERVLVLDLDPGQPEFTFPGCVSAVMVEEPVIGPNFTHITDPLRMTFFGELNVAQNPIKYLECVRHVIESCKESEELRRTKWLVNTMGFCKGLGVDLMITILKLVSPNTVVQIKGSDFKNNYPFYLTPATVNDKVGFRSMPLEDVQLSYDLRVVPSSAERDKKPIQGGLKRKQLRDIMSISYFSKMASPPFYNLNAVQPYMISFSKLYLGVDLLVEPKDVVKAFNGNIVSLSHFEARGEEILSVSSSGDYFQIVVKPGVAPCLGIGFIRGVDCEEKRFYLLTHLPAETLERVNCLSLGRVSAPHCMFLRQEAVESQTVYTTTCAIDIIRSVKRMFRAPGTVPDREKIHAKA